MSAPERVPEPDALSAEYHKAHKQLMLWSAILFIWELVGVDLSKAKDAGGNVGPIVTALKSPQAVPWVLLILVLYFLFKCSIEWAQCQPERRKRRVARIDFISAWAVSVAAVTLYVGQTISKVQFADLIWDRVNGYSLIIGLCGGFVLGLGIFMILRDHLLFGKKLDWEPGAPAILGAVVTIPIIIAIERFRGNHIRLSFVLIGLLIGGTVTLLIFLMPLLTFRRISTKASLPKKS